jgi:hypothetical protein
LNNRVVGTGVSHRRKWRRHGSEVGRDGNEWKSGKSHLYHYSQNGEIEGEGDNTVDGEEDSGECTQVPQSANTRVGAGAENGDLERIIPEDGRSNGIESIEDDCASLFGMLATSSTENRCCCSRGRRTGCIRMGKHGTGETERLVEAYGADDEWQGLREHDGVQRHTGTSTDGQGDEEGKDGRGENGDGKPQVRAQRPGGGEEPEEGGVHGHVAGQNEEDVE